MNQKKDKRMDLTGFRELFDKNATSSVNKIIYHFFVNIFRIIKDNANVVLFTTYGLGSVVQIIELSKINTSYIKFFSISQLIADGTFILTISLYIYICTKIFTYIFFILNVSKMLEYYLKVGKRDFIKSALLLIPLFLLFLFYNVLSTGYFNFSFITLIITFSFVYVLFTELLTYSFKHDDYFTSKGDNLLGIGLIYRIALIIVIINSLISIPTVFINLYRIPQNLDNYDKAKQLVMTDYKGQGITKDDIKIKYFNDKFMFIEITKPSKEKSIVIYQTNSALFDTRVITLNEEEPKPIESPTKPLLSYPYPLVPKAPYSP